MDIYSILVTTDVISDNQGVQAMHKMMKQVFSLRTKFC